MYTYDLKYTPVPLAASFLTFLYNQLFTKVPYPETSFAGQTVVVTGSNTGLGREAARHITRLGAEKVILAVRNASKGQAAKEYVEQATGKKGVVEVWNLDMSTYASVKAFVRRAETLPRLDVVLESAGMSTTEFVMFEENESTLTVNVVSTFLLALLILPKLRETAERFDVTPRLCIVSSEVHQWTDLSAKSYPRIFDAMNDKSTVQMSRRYLDSKLLQILYVRQLAARMSQSSKPKVALNVLNPGFCESELMRDPTLVSLFFTWLLARSAEEGSRTLVGAASAGYETHGEYLSNCVVTPVSSFARSKDGEDTARRVWTELNEKLDRIQPGILDNI